MHQNHTHDEDHETTAPLARLSILAQFALKRELDRLSAPYEPPRPEDYTAY